MYHTPVIAWSANYVLGFVTFRFGLLQFHARVCRGLDRMVVGFTTTYAIRAYHHWCCEFEHLDQGEVYNTM